VSGSWQLRLLRAGFRATQAVSTGAAARLGDRLFCTPPSSSVPAAVRELFTHAERSSVVADGDRVAVWRWGSGPAVALVHGWGSRAARLAVHVEPLLAAGFSVVAYDAPAHGESEGRLGSGIQSARALLAIAERTPLYGVVAHSLGSAATLVALRDGLELRRAVFIAPPSDIHVYVERFAEMFGARDDVVEAMMRRTEERLRFRWDDFDLVGMAAAVRSAELLLIHDRDDDEVSWHCGESIAAAWPGGTLVTTQGLGHHRIARDAEVVARAARFLAAGLERSGPSGPDASSGSGARSREAARA
jgi:pimeloyl-ACP methyl ester carboxylesterase